MFAVVIGGFGACIARVDTTVNQNAKKQVTVTYVVTGQGTALISYDTSTNSGEDIPVVIGNALGHSDPRRLEWIAAVVAASAGPAQIIVLACVPRT